MLCVTESPHSEGQSNYLWALVACLLGSRYANNALLTDFQRPRPQLDGKGGAMVSMFLPENSSMVTMCQFTHLHMNDVSDNSQWLFLSQYMSDVMIQLMKFCL